MSQYSEEIERRRTFAIISHPDAGKTTLTEKLLLFGGAIHVAGAVKSNKIKKTATSDWMEIEKQRGISVATSVMAFDYSDHKINILDTPGHQDFAEDTFRTLTAVDSVIIVIDIAKGVEAQTRKLMEVCRMRKTPVIVFVNKMDRDGKDPFDLLDEIEEELQIKVRPLSWPIDMGQRFRHAVRRIDRRGKGAYFRLQTVVHRSAADNQNIRLLQPRLFFGNTERVINLQRNHRRKSQRLFYIRKRMAGSRTHYQIQPRNQRTHHHHHSPYITKVHTQQSGISRLQVQKLASEAGALHHPVFAHHQLFRRTCGARRMDGDNRRGIEPLLQKNIQIPQGGRAVFRSLRHQPGYIPGRILHSLQQQTLSLSVEYHRIPLNIIITKP